MYEYLSHFEINDVEPWGQMLSSQVPLAIYTLNSLNRMFFILSFRKHCVTSTQIVLTWNSAHTFHALISHVSRLGHIFLKNEEKIKRKIASTLYILMIPTHFVKSINVLLLKEINSLPNVCHTCSLFFLFEKKKNLELEMIFFECYYY